MTLDDPRRAQANDAHAIAGLAAHAENAGPTSEDLQLAARLLMKVREHGDVRIRRVRKLRAAIRAGRYESAMKIDVAIGKILDDLRPRTTAIDRGGGR